MKRFGQVVMVAIGLMLATGSAHAQTASQKWRACREAAFWNAYDCYTASGGYWDDVACGFWWNFDDVACDNALIKSVIPD